MFDEKRSSRDRRAESIPTGHRSRRHGQKKGGHNVPGGLAERDGWGLGLPIVVDRDAARAMVVRGFQTSAQTVGGGGGAGEPVGLSILPLGGVAASYLYRAGRWHLQAEHNLFLSARLCWHICWLLLSLRSGFLVVLQVLYPSILTSCMLKKNRTITIPCPTCPGKPGTGHAYLRCWFSKV